MSAVLVDRSPLLTAAGLGGLDTQRRKLENMIRFLESQNREMENEQMKKQVCIQKLNETESRLNNFKREKAEIELERSIDFANRN